jgi:hypothetical protein
MNDFTFAQLEALVEQVLRPVWTTRIRKRMLREELLAHVMDVFADELADSGDERLALEKTLKRFGSIAEVGTEFQATFSLTKYLLSLFSKETFMSRWLWIVAVVAMFVGPGFIMPAVAKFNQIGVMPIFPLLVGIVITLAGLGTVGYGLKKRLAHVS